MGDTAGVEFDADTSLGALEEHLQGVLLGKGVSSSACRRFVSYHLVLGASFGRDPRITLGQLLHDHRPCQLATFAEEIDEMVHRFGTKQFLQNLLRDPLAMRSDE